jgi:arylsulfatase A-like enzyme
VAKRNLALETTYASFPVVDQTSPVGVEAWPGGYATDWLAARARSFVRTAPTGRPWFLLFAPSAPHPPFVPAGRHVGALGGADASAPPAETLNDVGDAAAWVRALPPIDAATAASLARQRLDARETLLAVDEALASLWAEVVARGEQDHTVVVLLSDNGYSFGEHRWIGKRCPYDACVRVPFVVRTPWTTGGTVDAPVSTLDVAPTIAALAGAGSADAGERGLVDLLRGGPAPARGPTVLWYAGDGVVPEWWAARDGRFELILTAPDDVELYDLELDPTESRDVSASRPDVVARLAAAIEAVRAEAGP